MGTDTLLVCSLLWMYFFLKEKSNLCSYVFITLYRFYGKINISSKGRTKNTRMLRFLEEQGFPWDYFTWKSFERFLVISTLS